jgi:molybdopterin synthase sulfur carrier subunit
MAERRESEKSGVKPPHSKESPERSDMAQVHIPAALRGLSDGATSVSVPGETLREVLDRLDELHPGLKERLVSGERMAPGLAVFVDGASPAAGLRTRLAPDAEIYFAPAIAGGSG